MNDRWQKLADKRPELAAKVKRLVMNREWKKAHQYYGERLDLTLEELRSFGMWLRGKSEGLAPVRPGLKIRHDADVMTLEAKGSTISGLADLLEAARVDLAVWRVERWTANTWEMAGKVSGGMEKTQLWQVKASLVRRRYPQHLEIQPVSTVKRERPQPRTDGTKRALFVPDIQVRFMWSRNYQYHEPMHDRRACELAVQAAQLTRPDVIVMLGDMADLAPWSTKYTRDPATKQTTAPTIRELHWWLARLRMAAPAARIIYMAGNHEDRIRKAQMEKLDESMGLTPADEPLDAPDVLDIRRLLALDALDIEYGGHYDSPVWLWDSVEITHGTTARSGGGATVGSKAKAGGGYHSVFGHVHRCELASRTTYTPHGPQVATIMSPGCLCRVDADSPVPGVKAPKDWQQGLGWGVLDSTGQAHLWITPIHDGRMALNGRIIEGQDPAEELAEATGFQQMVRP